MRLSKSCLSQKEIDISVEVLRREFLGMGPTVKKFEDQLAQFLGGNTSVVCVNTGTSALHLALQAIGVGAGDSVLAPSLTFVASYQAIAATGAEPISCDCNIETGLISLEHAQQKIKQNTKAIMYVHYGSEFGDLNSLYAFAKKNSLRVIEDAAHSFGCEFEGNKIGTMGDVTCFSFDGIKNITSIEGGAVVTRDQNVVEKIKNARLLGVEKDSENRYQKKRSWDFDVQLPGWRYHMGELNASIGLVQLERLQSEFMEKRIALASQYRNKLRGNKNVVPLASGHGSVGTKVVQHIMPVRVLNGKRDALKEFLQNQGIETGIHYKPNHLLTMFGGGRESLPNVEQLYSELLTLPLHPDLTIADVDLVLEKIAVFLG